MFKEALGTELDQALRDYCPLQRAWQLKNCKRMHPAEASDPHPSEIMDSFCILTLTTPPLWE